MFKYGRMQKKILPRLVSVWLPCTRRMPSHIDRVLPGAQVTAELGFFCVRVVYSDSEDSDSLP